MEVSNRSKSIQITLLLGGIWDIIGGSIFFIFHGILQYELIPNIYPFYSIVLGLFLFMQAYIQFLASTNLKRYCANIGVVIFLRTTFAVSVFLFSVLSEQLPTQFILIAIVDTIFTILQVYFTYKRADMKIRELFLPAPE